MSDHDFQRAAELFERARELAPVERATLLDELCAHDQSLRQEVESLLGHHDDTTAGLTDPILEVTPTTSGEAGQLATPETIGGYAIERVLGRGGMGIVYLAHQERPKRTVALKVIRAGVTSPALLRRFEFESEVLGRLQHPGIAQIFDAGTADTGHGPQPYFAMEFIDGVPLLEHAQKQQLTSRQCLSLMADVCDAVQHAHERGVIHRDLKPANIIVDTQGRPKVLDFGVARATASDLQTTTMLTEVGQFIGTLPYMSPEQVQQSERDLDIRCDVYALGVLLFELLTGDLPFDLRDKSVLEAARIIRDDEPTALSHTDRTLRGEVETIVARALAKERDRRYQSAAALADDIRRFLRDEPILARPASSLYQLRKFARRNRALVGGATTAAMVLILGMVGTSIGMARAISSEDSMHDAWVAEAEQKLIAEREARVAQAVNDFLNEDLLAQADPHAEPDRDILLREVLDRASVAIDDKFQEDAVVEAAIRMTLAKTYRGLGEYELAEAHVLRASHLREKALGPDDPATLEAHEVTGLIYWHQSKFDLALPLHQRTLETRRRVLGEEHEDTFTSMHSVGILLKSTGRYDEAQPLLEESLQLRREALGIDHPASLISLNALATLHFEQSRFAIAEPMYLEYLSRCRRVHGDEHPDTLTALNNLGRFYQDAGRLDEAEPLFAECYQTRQRVAGKQHPMTLVTMNNLGLLYDMQGRHDEAEPLYESVLDTRRNSLPAEHPDTLLSMHNLAGLYTKQGRFDEAETLYLETLEACRRVHGDTDRATLITLSATAVMYKRKGEPEKAEPLVAESVRGFKATMPDDHWYIGAAMSNYGGILTSLSRYEEAEQALLESHKRLAQALGEDHARSIKVREHLVTLYEDWQRQDEAEMWRARPPQAEDAAAEESSSS